MAQPSLQPSGDRRDLTLRQRLGLLLGVFLLGVVALGVTTHAALVERDAAVSGIEQRIEPARQGLYVLAVHSVAADRTDPRDVSLVEVAVALERLDGLLADEPGMADELADLERAVAGWQRGDVPRVAMLGEVDAFRQALQAEQAQARQRLVEADARMRSLLWTVLVLALVLVAAAGSCLQRWINVPLARIAGAADCVSEGDLHHPIPVVGVPELRELARNVERMRSRIVGLLETSTRATEALGQHGVAVASLRAELEPTVGNLPEGVSFAAALEPAEGMLAGDWYDCVHLGDGLLALAVVDVSGHGPEAGIFALRAKLLLLAALEDRKLPGEALAWLADHIGETDERFLTAFLAEVDTATGDCRWASAGHPPGALIQDGEVEYLEATGPILGPLPGQWRTQGTALREGALLLAYTDGLVETRSGQQQFGYARLRDLARDSVGLPPDRVVSECIRKVREFAGGRADDDITVVALSLAPVGSRPLLSCRTAH